MSNNLTIYDIAEKAGVSHTTVSRIINNRKASIAISEKTRNKVLQIIEEYNFKPKVFRGRKTWNIGVLYSAGDVQKPFSDPFYSSMLEGVEEEIKQQNYKMMLSSIDPEIITKESKLEIIDQGYVDGIILLGFIGPEIVELLDKKDLPVVLLDHKVDKPEILSVTSQGEQGGYDAAQYLINAGHRKIAYMLAASESPSFADRFAGYKRALSTAGIKFDPEIVVKTKAWEENGYQAMETIAGKRKELGITAMLASNDLLAVYALKYLNDHNIKCPDKFSLIGFDDIHPCNFVSPSLTTVKVDKIKMGKTAVQMLCNKIIDKGIAKKQVKIPTKLIIRGSAREIK